MRPVSLGVVYFAYWSAPLAALALIYVNELVEFFRITFFILPFVQHSYDFVVVGGGSAGSAVAARLAENGLFSVLLLEAGPSPPFIANVPLVVACLSNTPLDWAYKTVPQRGCCNQLENNSSLWTSGKAVGGGSVLNYMLYVRGNKLDYDHWEELGNEGWSYDDVLPFFKKAERQGGRYQDDAQFHGHDGPLSVEDRRVRTSLADAFTGAGQELGFDEVDVNGANQTGFAWPQVTMRDGQRWSSGRAYVRHNPRKNLVVLPRAFARKIVTEIRDGEQTAVGVEFSVYGLSYSVKAKKEVVVSSGTVGSAKLLMLSGIGPKEHLKDLKIDVVKDLKVGHNLQDHIMSCLTFIHQDSSLQPPHLLNFKADADFLFRGIGPFTGNGIDGVGFTTTKHSERSNWPDMQLHLFSFSMGSDFGIVLRRSLGLSDKYFDAYAAEIAGVESGMICPTLVRPKSRGRIMLRSRDPYEQPLIDPQYLTNYQDVKVLVEGLKFSLKIARTEAFKKQNITPVLLPCEDFEKESEEWLECIVRAAPTTVYHPAGSCKMGPDSDPYAVVDSKLRVRGVKRLRVIDVSIMPKVVNGNTNAPAIMIGEKGAQMVLDSWSSAASALGDDELSKRRNEL